MIDTEERCILRSFCVVIFLMSFRAPQRHEKQLVDHFAKKLWILERSPSKERGPNKTHRRVRKRRWGGQGCRRQRIKYISKQMIYKCKCARVLDWVCAAIQCSKEKVCPPKVSISTAYKHWNASLLEFSGNSAFRREWTTYKAQTVAGEILRVQWKRGR